MVDNIQLGMIYHMIYHIHCGDNYTTLFDSCYLADMIRQTLFEQYIIMSSCYN